MYTPINIKIVLNKEYGGFFLSDKAIELLATAKGFDLTNKSKNDIYLFWHNINRHDEDLITVVEFLGEKANGNGSKLVIEEITVGYEIRDYDGYESYI